MAKVGDKVRFLNTIGGGVITRIDGKTAYVEDQDGFESPILLKDIVVVMPAGHEGAVKGASIMFDQKAFDIGRKTEEETSPVKKMEMPVQAKPEETAHGDIPEFTLVFEPENVKKLGETKFTAVLVNDSNYYLYFLFLRRKAEEREWTLVYDGNMEPNELIDLAVIRQDEINDYERIALQCVAFKKDKTFSILPPVNVSRKIDLTKFHKFHCFRPGKYFDSPVLEFPLVVNGRETKSEQLNAEEIKEAMLSHDYGKDLAKELSKKYKTDSGKTEKKQENPASNPYKKLPLIEVDLHIGELTDTTSGMEPKDMLEMQLDEVRKTMSAHSKRTGQKIVFIHGKGEGVLRKAVLDFLKKEYPKAKLQDASFREYGFGATLVTI